MLFGPKYDRPGPGVSKDQPRKKGLARLLELLGRDFSSYWLAGGLAAVCFVPTAVCLFLTFSTDALLFALLGSAFGALGGPALAALYDTVLRTLRDEPGYWWHTYKKAFLRNAKAALLPGVCTAAMFSFALYGGWLLLRAGNLPLTVLLLVGAFLCTALLSFYWAQLVLLELPWGTVLRNSLLLTLGYLPRAAGAALLKLAYWAAAALFFPWSGLVFVLTGLWLPVCLALLTVYPILDKSFALEARIAQKRDAK